MEPFTVRLAEDLYSWRNDLSTSRMGNLGKRIIMGAVGLPLLFTAAVVEAAARTVFWTLSPLLSCLSPIFAESWGSADLLKETIVLIPFIALSFLDNIYSPSLDKDSSFFLHSYSRICFREED